MNQGEDSNATQLKSTLDRFHILSIEEFLDFLDACTFQAYEKKDFLLRQGNKNYGMYFVLEGAIGLFEWVDGKEVYQNFFLKGEFANELVSLTKQTTTSKNLIALSNTEVYFINRSRLLELYEKSVSFEKLGRKLLEFILSTQNELSFVLQSMKPTEKYEYLLSNKPSLLAEIPLTHLASYLGLARETLSRIRSKKL